MNGTRQKLRQITGAYVAVSRPPCRFATGGEILMNVFWSDIESRFLKLHSEQRSANGLVHAINCDDSWTLGGPEDLQKKFRSIVRNIAVRLGWANDKDPLSDWCELLKKHGVGYHRMTGSIDRRRFELDTEQMCSIEREQRDTQGGIINSLCKMSAEYCIECDTKEAAATGTAVGRQIFVAENSGKTGQAEGELVKRGKFCDQVIDEMKRIKNLVVGTGRNIAEVQQDHPDLAAWKVRTQLDSETQETFNHPRQWGPVVGFAKMVLSKIHGVSTSTITSWIKVYRKGRKTRKA
jgi:hypothetical protein